MQKYALFTQPDINVLDILSYVRSSFSTPYYVLEDYRKTDFKDNEIDIVIYSALYAPDTTCKNKVAVVSYLPCYGTSDWLKVFVNTYNSTIVACDSFIYNAGVEKGLFKDKLWINLDGAIIPDKLLTIDKNNVDCAYIGFIGNERVVTSFSNYVNSEDSWITLNTGIKATQNLQDATYIISLDDLGFSLTNLLTRTKRFIQVPFNEKTAYWLDSRYTHVYKRLNEYSTIVGGGGSKLLKDTMDVFFEEYIALALHNNTSDNPAINFTSNVSIFDRIFHELNRSK